MSPFLLLVIPLVELWLLIVLGSEIGGFTTILWIVFSALLGAAMLRAAGTSAFQDMTEIELRSPTHEWLDTIFLAVGGFLLIIPGFITDAAGLLLLPAPARRYFVNLVLRRSGASRVIVRYAARVPFQRRDHRPTIDSEWRNDDDDAHKS